jgi:hypothetical protein
MPLSATGNPLHTRSLSVTLAEAPAPDVAFAAYVLDLRKRGFAPVGGDLQGTGIIHHMRLNGRLDRAAARVTAIDAEMPNVAFEASPSTGGESCRDQIGRVAGLAGQSLDQTWSPALGTAIGGVRGCSHILTLAHLLAPTARWAFAEDVRLFGGAPARRLGERIFRRDVTLDGYEPTMGELVFTLQLNDLHFAPAPALAAPMDRFGAQREIVARATLTMQTLELTSLELRERVADHERSAHRGLGGSHGGRRAAGRQLPARRHHRPYPVAVPRSAARRPVARRPSPTRARPDPMLRRPRHLGAVRRRRRRPHDRRAARFVWMWRRGEGCRKGVGSSGNAPSIASAGSEFPHKAPVTSASVPVRVTVRSPGEDPREQQTIRSRPARR